MVDYKRVSKVNRVVSSGHFVAPSLIAGALLSIVTMYDVPTRRLYILTVSCPEVLRFLFPVSDRHNNAVAGAKGSPALADLRMMPDFPRNFVRGIGPFTPAGAKEGTGGRLE